MSDPLSIASIIIAASAAVGGIFGYFHFKLNSNCCSCCKLECSENQNKKTPPQTPINKEPIKLNYIKEISKSISTV